MNRISFLLLSTYLVMACASDTFAAVTLKRLGTSPFSLTSISSEAGLRNMVEERSVDLRIAFAKAGSPELFPGFLAQFHRAKIDSIQIGPGERFKWMLFRNKTTGTVKVISDVIWAGKAAFGAFKFHINARGQRYEFIVPVGCGNLSLKSVGVLPKLASVIPDKVEVVPERIALLPQKDVIAVPRSANQNPICKMRLSSSKINCGQAITVDATSSRDPDGSISEITFKMLDAANLLIAEKIDKEAPFVQKFTIPCKSSQYTIKAVAIDNKKSQSSPDDCTQTIRIAKRKGGLVAGVGLARQLDPSSYVFGRVGYEVSLTEKLYTMALAGGFARFDGNDGDSAFTADALLNYYLTENIFVGGGIGLWSGDNGKTDLILDIGYLVHEKPGSMKTYLLLEGRCEADDLISNNASRLGMGLLFQF